MSIVANWSYPTAIRFGAGRISEIGEACAAAGIKKTTFDHGSWLGQDGYHNPGFRPA